MIPRTRLLLFVTGAVGLGVVLLVGALNLPLFGDYRGPYGNLILENELAQRRALSTVAAVTFDYRGFDTLGEEFILFAAVIGVTLLLRVQPDEVESTVGPRQESSPPPTSEAVFALGMGLVGPTVLFGIYVVTHGHLSPGGGFQGGVVLAAGLLLVYLSGRFAHYRRLTPVPLIDSAEAFGAGGYAVVGLLGLVAGAAFLENVLPLGSPGELFSSGTIFLINVVVGLEVAAAFVLLLDEFLEQAVLIHRRSS
jgi:multicomponent Na+:H+ antiporter subunit B